MTERRRGAILAAGAALAWATSAPLMRLADPLSPFEKTVGRLLVAVVAVAVVARISGRGLRLRELDPRRFALYSAVAAAHWALYIASLDRTTIAHALALIYASPVFVAALSAVCLREPVPRRKWPGIAIAIAGVAVLVGFEPALTPEMLAGDLLALGSALGFGVYSIVGRYERDRTPLLTYAFAVWVGAAVWSAPFAAVTASDGWSPGPIGAVVLAGLLPFALGQTLYTAALRRLDATAANLVGTLEVVVAVAIGVALFGEVPSATTLVGGLLTLAGVALVLR